MFMMVSCENRHELEGLRVQSRLYNLTAEEGSTPVIVYAGGDWTVSLTEDVDWAGLDRDHGHGQGQVMFTYSANEYLVRKVGVVFDSQGLRDTVMMVQAAGMTDSYLSFSKTLFELPGCSGMLNVPYESNLGQFRSLLKSEILYDADSAGDWVTDLQFDTVAVSCKVMPYAGSVLVRKAKIVLHVDDGAGNAVADTVRVSQSSAQPYFCFSDPGKLKALGGTVTLAMDSNLGDYVKSPLSSISLDFGGVSPWAALDLEKSTDDSLVLTLSENHGNERTVNVYFSYVDNEEKTHRFPVALTQLCLGTNVPGANEAVVDDLTDSFEEWDW